MHWLHPSLEKRERATGSAGIFAVRAIESGTLLCVWGGRAVTSEQLQLLGEARRTHSIQVHWDLYLAPDEPLHPADYFNHSCAPNAGFSCSITLVAMKRIASGDSVCFDYAMSDSSPYDEFECGCGAPECRLNIRAEDWQRPELQRRYNGYFSPYLQRSVDVTLAATAAFGGETR